MARKSSIGKVARKVEKAAEEYVIEPAKKAMRRGTAKQRSRKGSTTASKKRK